MYRDGHSNSTSLQRGWGGRPRAFKNSGHILDRGTPPSPNLRGHARRGVETTFTDGRSSDEWLQQPYDGSQTKALGVNLPFYGALQTIGCHYVNPSKLGSGALAAFGIDQDCAPRQTPSGRIEVTPKTTASLKNSDLLAQSGWYPATEWLGHVPSRYLFHLILGQRAENLRSQLGHGLISRAAKVDGRATIGLDPLDADKKGIGERDAVRADNDRGACLATAKSDSAIRTISPGAWLDDVPEANGTLLCRCGNPDTLTAVTEVWNCLTAHSCLIDVENVHGSARPVHRISTTGN